MKCIVIIVNIIITLFLNEVLCQFRYINWHPFYIHSTILCTSHYSVIFPLQSYELQGKIKMMTTIRYKCFMSLADLLYKALCDPNIFFTTYTYISRCISDTRLLHKTLRVLKQGFPRCVYIYFNALKCVL